MAKSETGKSKQVIVKKGDKATPEADIKNEKPDVVAEAVQTPEEILKAKKAETKAAKKAGPKHARAKHEVSDGGKRELAKDKQDAKAKSKHSQKPPRSRLERRGKKYKEVHKLLEKDKKYSVSEAVDLAQKTSYVKFDAAVELHVRLNVDPKQADQAVRGTVTLPHGSGKSQRVAALVNKDDVNAAKAAGADIAGEDDLLEQISKGKFNFDILVTTPEFMPKLGKNAKELGPRGLMPNPKSGTVTSNIAKVIKELKSGRVEFRIDGAGIIHQTVGRHSFSAEQLRDNTDTLISAIRQARPDGVKGAYVNSITLTTTMGPPIPIETTASSKA